MMAAPRRIYTGFTLIEVLIALVVIATSMSAALAGLRSTIVAEREIRERVIAHWTADNVLNETLLGLGEFKEGVRRGSVDQMGQTIYYEATLTPEPRAGSRRLDIRVALGASDGLPVDTLSAIIPGPGTP